MVRHLQASGYDVLGMNIREPTPEFSPLHHRCDLLDMDQLLFGLIRDIAPVAILASCGPDGVCLRHG